MCDRGGKTDVNAQTQKKKRRAGECAGKGWKQSHRLETGVPGELEINRGHRKTEKRGRGKTGESPSPTAHPDHSVSSLEGTLGFPVLPLIWSRKLRHRRVR